MKNKNGENLLKSCNFITCKNNPSKRAHPLILKQVHQNPRPQYPHSVHTGTQQNISVHPRSISCTAEREILCHPCVLILCSRGGDILWRVSGGRFCIDCFGLSCIQRFPPFQSHWSNPRVYCLKKCEEVSLFNHKLSHYSNDIRNNGKAFYLPFKRHIFYYIHDCSYNLDTRTIPNDFR